MFKVVEASFTGGKYKVVDHGDVLVLVCTGEATSIPLEPHEKAADPQAKPRLAPPAPIHLELVDDPQDGEQCVIYCYDGGGGVEVRAPNGAICAGLWKRGAIDLGHGKLHLIATKIGWVQL